MPEFKTADGLRLHYSEEGTGPAVIALAGLTRNGMDFDHVAPHLPVRLIRLDYRGRGRSDWADPATYTIPQEAQDTLALMDHLNLPQAAILGTSRGGLIAMVLAATARNRLSGVALNDIGPRFETTGLDVIMGYIGRRPAQKSYTEAAAFRAESWTQFRNVPMARWEAEVRQHYVEAEDGLDIRYDGRLRDAILASSAEPAPDLWPFFEALKGLPTALIRGANSDLLSAATAAEMQHRHPDMIFASVPDRGHVPFLDEPEALQALTTWVSALP